jgi:hypothetical protein
MALTCEKPAESLLMFGLEAQKADSHLTLFDPSNHGKINADGQRFSGRSQDQLKIAGRLNPGSSLNTTTSGG